MLQAILAVCIALFSVRTTISNPTFSSDINPKRGAAVRPTVGTEIARRRQGFASQLKSHWRPAMEVFFDLCELPRLKKKPFTSQLLDWLQLLIADELPAEVWAHSIGIASRRSPNCNFVAYNQPICLGCLYERLNHQRAL